MSTSKFFSVPVLEELVIRQLPVPSHPATTFDEERFLALLARSMSLAPEEKVNILARIPTFSQQQIDNLLTILTKEGEQFAALEARLDERLRRAAEDCDAKARRRTFTLIHGGQA